MRQNEDVRIIKAFGTFSVVPSVDSLLASFEVKSCSDGVPLPKPFTLSGRANGDGSTFLQRQEARLNMNGEEMVRQAKVTWNLRATGAALVGDTQRDIEGLITGSGDAAPLTGSRVKPRRATTAGSRQAAECTEATADFRHSDCPRGSPTRLLAIRHTRALA